MNPNILILLVYLSIVLPLGIIIYARLVRPLGMRLVWRLVWGGLLLFLIVFSFSSRLLTSVFDNDPFWTALPYYLMTFFIMIIVGCVLHGVVLLGVRVFRRKDDEIEEPSRREFLKKASVATVGVAACLTPVSVVMAKEGRVVREVDLALESFPASLDGLRVVHLSDIHVGNTFDREDMQALVNETNALKPDIIVITGDIVDGDVRDIGSWMEPVREFKAPHGVYFVTGNHDHMSGARAWCALLESFGVVVLDNAHRDVTIGGTTIAVAGAIDARGARRERDWQSSPETALAGIPSDRFKLLLVHQPTSIERSLESGADLVLAGHTHGGQFWPLCYLIDAMYVYARGLYRVGRKAVYVSCGTGYWGPPVRIGVPPEIAVITLCHAESGGDSES